MTKEELSLQIIKYRNANKMCQDTLALKLGVSQASVAAWEAGKSYPHGRHLEDLKSLFAIPDLATENSYLKNKIIELELSVDFYKERLKKSMGWE